MSDDFESLSKWGEHVGEEVRNSYQRYIEEGFIKKYLSGPNVLDIGYRGYVQDVVPVVPQAVGVDLDYPGYDGTTLPFADASQDAIFTSHVLQHIDDYRSSLRDWFRVIRVGGHMIIAVPHQFLYEKRMQPPSRFNADHKRFYTPGLLMLQIEEALDPFSYRVRLLEDNDRGYDYDIPPDREAAGCREIVLVLQKIERPAWADGVLNQEPPVEEIRSFLEQFPADGSVERTLAYIPHAEAPESVLVVKLDHRGDLLLAERALRTLRATFPAARLTLACGPWNQATAEELGLFDEIVPVSFFPEKFDPHLVAIDAAAGIARFEKAFAGRHFDVAIDLRLDADTRPLLAKVNADRRVGFGNRRVWPFLDVYLDYVPPTIECHAVRFAIPASEFYVQSGRHEGVYIEADTGGRSWTGKKRLLLYGGYRDLGAGTYILKPAIAARKGAPKLAYDITKDSGKVTLAMGEIAFEEDSVRPIRITMEENADMFEFRIHGGGGTGSFSFYGLNVERAGRHDSLHQSEAMTLLSVLTALRLSPATDSLPVGTGS